MNIGVCAKSLAEEKRPGEIENMKIREGKKRVHQDRFKDTICSSVMRPAGGTENKLIHAISQLSGLHSHFKTNKTVHKQSQHQQTDIHFLV